MISYQNSGYAGVYSTEANGGASPQLIWTHEDTNSEIPAFPIFIINAYSIDHNFGNVAVLLEKKRF